MRSGSNIVFGVAGGIAAYKACSAIRSLAKLGHNVRVVPTQSALKFIGAATFEALSHNKVTADVFDDISEVEHVRLGAQADLIVIAPATADLLARLAQGDSDDLLTSTVLNARCPVLIFPAMHTQMFNHPATKRNIAKLRSYGYCVINPAIGRLTGEDVGLGRMPEAESIVTLSQLLLERSDALPYDLEDNKILISAGSTREAIDPVRFLSNRSSGKQGYALAQLAHARGAEVTLVSGITTLLVPEGVDRIQVQSAKDMQEIMLKHSQENDIVIMAAAVADFRPKDVRETKLKKNTGDLKSISLIENLDILSLLVAERNSLSSGHQSTIVGFAAETGDSKHSVLEYARMKLEHKGCDLLVVNAVGRNTAFEVDNNSGWILSRDGKERKLELGSKFLMASYILDSISAFRSVFEIS